MTCIWVATKYEEVHPLSLNLVTKMLGHNKFEEEEIKKMEI